MSIFQFLSTQPVQWRVLDLGRSIRVLSAQEVEAFEHKLQPYTTPYLQHAWLAIISWNPAKDQQHSIWFLKFPLDEFNIIQPHARDAFLEHWLKTLDQPKTAEAEAPHSFKPDANRMAYFHAKALRLLEQPASQFYHAAMAYVSGDLGFENWQTLGIQGLAEFASRLDEGAHAELLAQALPLMPAQPKHALLGFLEHENPNATLSQVLLSQAKQASIQEQPFWIRALSNSVERDARRDYLRQVLVDAAGLKLMEVYVTLSSRCWMDLDGELMLPFLDALAAEQFDPQVFEQIVLDLMTQPTLREQVLGAFRNPSRSDELAVALGHLFKRWQVNR